jgi:hypothetical protein
LLERRCLVRLKRTLGMLLHLVFFTALPLAAEEVTVGENRFNILRSLEVEEGLRVISADWLMDQGALVNDRGRGISSIRLTDFIITQDGDLKKGPSFNAALNYDLVSASYTFYLRADKDALTLQDRSIFIDAFEIKEFFKLDRRGNRSRDPEDQPVFQFSQMEITSAGLQTQNIRAEQVRDFELGSYPLRLEEGPQPASLSSEGLRFEKIFLSLPRSYQWTMDQEEIPLQGLTYKPQNRQSWTSGVNNETRVSVEMGKLRFTAQNFRFDHYPGLSFTVQYDLPAEFGLSSRWFRGFYFTGYENGSIFQDREVSQNGRGDLGSLVVEYDSAGSMYLLSGLQFDGIQPQYGKAELIEGPGFKFFDLSFGEVKLYSDGSLESANLRINPGQLTHPDFDFSSSVIYLTHQGLKAGIGRSVSGSHGQYRLSLRNLSFDSGGVLDLEKEGIQITASDRRQPDNPFLTADLVRRNQQDFILANGQWTASEGDRRPVISQFSQALMDVQSGRIHVENITETMPFRLGPAEILLTEILLESRQFSYGAQVSFDSNFGLEPLRLDPPIIQSDGDGFSFTEPIKGSFEIEADGWTLYSESLMPQAGGYRLASALVSGGALKDLRARDLRISEAGQVIEGVILDLPGLLPALGTMGDRVHYGRFRENQLKIGGTMRIPANLGGFEVRMEEMSYSNRDWLASDTYFPQVFWEIEGSGINLEIWNLRHSNQRLEFAPMKITLPPRLGGGVFDVDYVYMNHDGSIDYYFDEWQIGELEFEFDSLDLRGGIKAAGEARIPYGNYSLQGLPREYKVVNFQYSAADEDLEILLEPESEWSTISLNEDWSLQHQQFEYFPDFEGGAVFVFKGAAAKAGYGTKLFREIQLGEVIMNLTDGKLILSNPSLGSADPVDFRNFTLEVDQVLWQQNRFWVGRPDQDQKLFPEQRTPAGPPGS